MGESLQKSMGGARAPADGAATPMKIPDLDPARIGYLGNLFLGAVQCPLTGEQPRVFVAVAVAQHDLLHRVLASANLLLQVDASPYERMLEVFRHDARGGLQIFDRLEQWHHMDFRGRPIGCFPPETDLAHK